MKRLEFSPTDVNSWNDPVTLKKVQDKFDQWFKENIENAPIVYSQNGGTDMEDNKKERWVGKAYSIPSDTHTARLVMIEPIPKKECLHNEIFFSEVCRKFVCTECKQKLEPKGGWTVCE